MKNIFWLSLSVSVLSFTGMTIFYKYKEETEKNEKRAAWDKHFYEKIRSEFAYYYTYLNPKDNSIEQQVHIELHRDDIKKTQEQMHQDGYSYAEIDAIYKKGRDDGKYEAMEERRELDKIGKQA